MLIGFRLDLTDLVSPRRGTASSQGEGFCLRVSRGKGVEGEDEGREKESGVELGGEGGGGQDMMQVWKCERYC